MSPHPPTQPRPSGHGHAHSSSCGSSGAFFFVFLFNRWLPLFLIRICSFVCVFVCARLVHYFVHYPHLCVLAKKMVHVCVFLTKKRYRNEEKEKYKKSNNSFTLESDVERRTKKTNKQMGTTPSWFGSMVHGRCLGSRTTAKKNNRRSTTSETSKDRNFPHLRRTETKRRTDLRLIVVTRWCHCSRLGH